MNLKKLAPVWIPLLLALAGLLAYSNSFSIPFLYDGIGSIRDNPNIRSLWPIWETVSAAPGLTVAGRPVLAVSLALNYQLSGLEVWSYHLFNLLFHVLAALLLFGIVRRTLLSEGLKERFGRSAQWLALATSLLWLLHPLHTNAVTYVNQRAESLMGMFYLLTLYCAVRAFTSERRLLWMVLAWTACALGAGTKEVIATAPVLVLLYDRIFVSASFKEIFRRNWPLYAGLFATWALVLLSVFSGARNASGFGLGWSPVQYAVTQSHVIVAVYLKLAVWPHPLVFDYGALVVRDIHSCLPQMIALLALLAATGLGLRYRPKLGYLGAWFFIILAPTSSIMPIITQVAVEYRMYLSLAAVIILIVLGFHSLLSHLFVRVRVRVRERLRFATSAILCLLCAGALTTLTHLRNHDYHSAISIWTDTIQKAPGNPRAYLNRGVTHAEQGNLKAAMADFTKAIEVDPTIASAYLNRGRLLLQFKQPKQALEDLEFFIRAKPGNAEAHNLRGMARGATGDHDGAVSDFNQALELAPGHPEALANRGIAYANKHDFKNALPDLERSIKLNPDDPRTQLSMAAVLTQLRRAKDAVPYYREVIRMIPDHAQALNNLAFILATHPKDQVRNGKEAVRLAEEACRLTKHRIPRALETLAAAYAEVGRFEEAIEIAEKAKKLFMERLKPPDATRLTVEINLYKKNIPYRVLQ